MGKAPLRLPCVSLPEDTVTVGLSADNTECSVAPASLALTTENWEAGATATVTAQNDDLIDGPQVCNIVTAAAVSADTTFDGENPDDVVVTVTDDDGPMDASIGDYVWLDQDADGVQDATETGISGVTVFLDLDDDTTLDAGEPFATTDAAGAYDITGLAAGTYSVRVDDTTVPAGYDLTTANIPLPSSSPKARTTTTPTLATTMTPRTPPSATMSGSTRTPTASRTPPKSASPVSPSSSTSMPVTPLTPASPPTPPMPTAPTTSPASPPVPTRSASTPPPYPPATTSPPPTSPSPSSSPKARTTTTPTLATTMTPRTPPSATMSGSTRTPTAYRTPPKTASPVSPSSST